MTIPLDFDAGENEAGTSTDTPNTIIDHSVPSGNNQGTAVPNGDIGEPGDIQDLDSDEIIGGDGATEGGGGSGSTIGDFGTTIDDDPQGPVDTTDADAVARAKKAEDLRKQLAENVTDPFAYLENRGLDLDNINITADENSGQFLDDQAFQIDPLKASDASLATVSTGALDDTGQPIPQSPSVEVDNFNAELIDPSGIISALDRINEQSPMVAGSMIGELNNLLSEMDNGNVPTWARPAVTSVEQMLAKRGISASSVGRDSLFNAIIQAAIPIAKQDATFKHDASKTTYDAKVKAILSDVATENAAKQFNAQSINQRNQFMSNLKAQVDNQNASRKDTVNQFNASMKADLAKFTSQLETQTSQFNAAETNGFVKHQESLALQRSQFNAQNATAIAQSNVSWRRQMNQINTAGQNQVLQQNAMNAFNLSNKALSDLWQETRDEAQWTMQATQDELQRKHELEAILIEQSMAEGIAEGADSGTRAVGIANLIGTIFDVEEYTDIFVDIFG